jgi:hypothetical protein
MNYDFNELVYDVIVYKNEKLYIDFKSKIIYDKNKNIINKFENFVTIGKSENEILEFFLKNGILKS